MRRAVHLFVARHLQTHKQNNKIKAKYLSRNAFALATRGTVLIEFNIKSNAIVIKGWLYRVRNGDQPLIVIAMCL